MSRKEAGLRSGEVDYSLADFRALARVIPPTIWHLANIAGWVLFIGATVIFGLSRVVNTPYALTDYLAVLGLATVFIFLGSAAVRARIWRWQLRRNRLYSPSTFVVRDDTFQILSSTGDLSLPWTSILSTRRMDERLFAFISRYAAYIIPRRAFGSDAEFDAFIAFVEERWKTSQLD